MDYLTDVYILNAEGLAEELQADTLSEPRALKHTIVAAIIAGFTVYFPVGIEFQSSEFWFFGNIFESLTYFVLMGAVSYYGIWLCYQTNAKGDGKDFFLRLSVLTLPVMIRVWILTLFVGTPILIAGTLISITFFDDSASTLIFVFQYLVNAVFAVVFFIKLHKYFGIASGSSVSQP